MSGLQIQQAKYTASIGGRGPPPSLAGQQPQSLIYTVHKPRALHNQKTRHPSPEQQCGLLQCPPPEQGGDRSERGRRDRLIRVTVGAGNGSRSLQINLFEVSASTGKGEKRKPVESVRHINPQRGMRPLRLLGCTLHCCSPIPLPSSGA